MGISLTPGRLDPPSESDRKLDTLSHVVAAIGHELKNPVQALTNLLHLLENSPTLDDTSRTLIEHAKHELQRIEQVANFSLEGRKKNQPIECVKPRDIIEDVLNFYLHKIEYKQVDVQRRYETDGEVQAFRGEMRLVFNNLIINALEAVPIRGKLAIHIMATAIGSVPGTRVIVADNGPGICDVDRARIFEPFFSTKQKGTGIGLWVVREIVRKHSGRIHMHSCTLPGRSGTTFSVTIPSNLPI